MTDYSELVEALRCKRDDCEGCDLAFLDKDEGWMCQYAAKDDDAAAAIEALQAENPIVESVLVDKMRQQMEETVCHCNVKENAELIARILDDDVDGKVFELPKRCEIVRCRECKWYDPLDRTRPFFCPVMDCVTGVMEDDFCSRGERRAKMEVQDG